MKSSEYEVVKFVDLSRISRHINRIYSEGELSKESTLAENAIVQNEKGRLVRCKLKMYNLDIMVCHSCT